MIIRGFRATPPSDQATLRRLPSGRAALAIFPWPVMQESAMGWQVGNGIETKPVCGATPFALFKRWLLGVGVNLSSHHLHRRGRRDGLIHDTVTRSLTKGNDFEYLIATEHPPNQTFG
jgi:hypothetical protein